MNPWKTGTTIKEAKAGWNKRLPDKKLDNRNKIVRELTTSKFMKNKVLPPTYFLIFLALIIGFHFIFPITKIVPSPYNWFGIVLIVFGAVLNLWTDNIFKKEKTTVRPDEKPSALIVSGPFRLSRHPMYLGMTAILLGVVVFLGSLTPFFFPIIFVILMQTLFIPKEEKNLEAIFGQKYLDYKKKVRCWI